MDFEKIERLIKLMKSSGLEELELEENKNRIHLKLPSPMIKRESLATFQAALEYLGQDKKNKSDIGKIMDEIKQNF